MDSQYFDNQVENARNHLTSITEHHEYDSLKDEVQLEVDRMIMQIDALVGAADTKVKKSKKGKKKTTKKGKKKS